MAWMSRHGEAALLTELALLAVFVRSARSAPTTTGNAATSATSR